MKCARMKVVLEMTVPYEYMHKGEAKTWSDDAIEFDVNDNRCIGTGNVGAFIDNIIEWGDEHSVCWGCPIQESMELLEIVEIGEYDLKHHPWLEAQWRKVHAAREVGTAD